MNKIEIFKILFYTSIVIWLFPPVRQWKTKYFYFFLILALADPVSMFLKNYVLSSNIHFYYPFISLLLFFSVYRKDNANEKFYFPVTLTISSFTFILTLIMEQSQLAVGILHFLIVFLFLKEFIIRFSFKSELDIFLLIVIFYEFTTILKYLNVTFGFTNATAYFIITSIFQISFGLFFSIVRGDRARVVIQR